MPAKNKNYYADCCTVHQLVKSGNPEVLAGIGVWIEELAGYSSHSG